MRALQIKRTLWTVALGGALAVTAAAPAQFGLSGGIGEAFRPSFTSRDVQLAVEMLDLLCQHRPERRFHVSRPDRNPSRAGCGREGKRPGRH